MEDIVMNEFWAEFKSYLQYVNWLYIINIMLWGFVMNIAVKNAKKKKKNGWFVNVPTVTRMAVLGTIIAFVFIWMFDYRTKSEYVKLFLSLPLAMLMWSLFFKPLIGKLSNKQGQNKTENNIV